MKKVLAILLLVIIVLSCAACGQDKPFEHSKEDIGIVTVAANGGEL